MAKIYGFTLKGIVSYPDTDGITVHANIYYGAKRVGTYTDRGDGSYFPIIDFDGDFQKRKEMEELLAFAGLTEVTGEGVTVTMNDSSTHSGSDMNAYLVHAEDLLSVVNELNGAGAKAVSINGQRMVGQSAITCAGSIVMVNGVRVAAPFEIKAVGDPAVMDSALHFPGGVIDNLAPWGIEISVRKETAVTVAAYTQTALFRETEEE